VRILKGLRVEITEVRILKDLPKPALKVCVDSNGVRGARNTNFLEVRIIKELGETRTKAEFGGRVVRGTARSGGI
jgi:hypothetical protein